MQFHLIADCIGLICRSGCHLVLFALRKRSRKMTHKSLWLLLPVFALSGSVMAQDYKSGIEWQQPPIISPGESNAYPPSDAIVLFDGTDLSEWNGGQWKIEGNEMVASKGGITTKRSFGDIQLHLEWSAPTEVKGTSQGRGNSGVFLMGRYEVQVLDSFDNVTYFDGQAASVYKQTPPMVNAMRKPGEWNAYDIFWTAPEFQVNGDVKTPAYVTVVHNGVLVLNHFELMGPTNFVDAPHYSVHETTGPISLQDHGNPVRFRNIWVRELNPPVGKRVSMPYYMQGGKKVGADQVKRQKESARFEKAVRKAVTEELRKRDEQQKKRQEAKAAQKEAQEQAPEAAEAIPEKKP